MMDRSVKYVKDDPDCEVKNNCYASLRFVRHGADRLKQRIPPKETAMVRSSFVFIVLFILSVSLSAQTDLVVPRSRLDGTSIIKGPPPFEWVERTRVEFMTTFHLVE